MRKRYVYRPGDPKANERGFVDITGEEAPMTARQVARADVSFMDGVRATDGADISSKRKRREYMKINNLADADDFSGVWASKQKERAQIAEGRLPDRSRRDDVGRALHRLHPE